MDVTFESMIGAYRTDIGRIAKEAKDMAEWLKNPDCEVPEGADKGEMIANAVLAYRHLEDARMRLGKVLQARNGGVSVFDK